MLVEVSTATQSNILSRSTKIGSLSVSVEVHKTLNFSCSVISVADRLHSTNEELLETMGFERKTSGHKMKASALSKRLPRLFSAIVSSYAVVFRDGVHHKLCP